MPSASAIAVWVKPRSLRMRLMRGPANILRSLNSTLPIFTIHDKIDVMIGFDNIYKITWLASQNTDSITSIMRRFCRFFWRQSKQDCKSGHRKSAGKLLFPNQFKV